MRDFENGQGVVIKGFSCVSGGVRSVLDMILHIQKQGFRGYVGLGSCTDVIGDTGGCHFTLFPKGSGNRMGPCICTFLLKS